VELLRPYVDFITACPEIELGLGVPRSPIRVVENKNGVSLVQPSTGLDLSEKMEAFSAVLINKLKDKGVDAFILKDSSPSCGYKNVKHYTKADQKNTTTKGFGIFGKKIKDGFPFTVVEDEGRLTNFTFREVFLTRLFITAAFREIKTAGKMKDLVNFQTVNKLLFLAYNETGMRKLGKLTANADKKPVEEVFRSYEEVLGNIFLKPAKPGAAVNLLQHAFGYFSENISKDERTHYIKQLEKFKKGKLPLSAVTLLTMSYITRFKITYLKEQTFFAPYPENLVSISDSGAGRDSYR
jgi:uncharacterized protein YbgA (DUF1722 family)/uncharacterized protein YbbK (DUF523 family)